MAKYNIGKGQLTLAPRKYEEVLFVEVDEKTFNNFVETHAIRSAIQRMLKRRVIVLDRNNMRIEGNEDIRKAALLQGQSFLSRLKWSSIEIDDQDLKREIEPP